jgi:hypothetical protein
MLAVLIQNTLVFELHNRRRVSGTPVGVDAQRVRMVYTSQDFGRKRLAAKVSRLAERRKSIVTPAESTAAV